MTRRCAARGGLVERRQQLEFWRKSSVVGPRPHCWQSESKNRAMIELAGHADGAAVSFHNGFGNRQSHSSTLDDGALIFAAIKFVEDQTLFHSVNSWTLIGNAEHDRTPVIF